jgi:FMN phosphatase YigB (HAD superfamily)
LPSLLLFDFDDTLAITERYMAGPFFPRMQQILVRYGVKITLEELAVKNTELYTQYGSSMHGWMHELGLTMADTLDMFSDMAPFIREAVMPHLVPNPGLLAHLDRLQKQGHTLAILTLGHRDYCLPLIEKLGIHTYIPPQMVFDISVMEGRVKRHEDTYKHLLKKHLPSHFTNMFMFEDSMANLLAAKKAGFTTIYIKNKPVPSEVTHAIDYHNDDINEALNYVSDKIIIKS